MEEGMTRVTDDVISGWLVGQGRADMGNMAILRSTGEICHMHALIALHDVDFIRILAPLRFPSHFHITPSTVHPFLVFLSCLLSPVNPLFSLHCLVIPSTDASLPRKSFNFGAFQWRILFKLI